MCIPCARYSIIVLNDLVKHIVWPRDEYCVRTHYLSRAHALYIEWLRYSVGVGLRYSVGL
jgi:hypothetical protein